MCPSRGRSERVAVNLLTHGRLHEQELRVSSVPSEFPPRAVLILRNRRYVAITGWELRKSISVNDRVIRSGSAGRQSGVNRVHLYVQSGTTSNSVTPSSSMYQYGVVFILLSSATFSPNDNRSPNRSPVPTLRGLDQYSCVSDNNRIRKLRTETV